MLEEYFILKGFITDFNDEEVLDFTMELNDFPSDEDIQDFINTHEVDRVEVSKSYRLASSKAKTNGDVIRDMFPSWNIEFVKMLSGVNRYDATMPTTNGFHTTHCFDEDWWNAPYEEK